MELLNIAWTVITPIFLMMGVGFAVQRGIGFDIRSLTRLNFWVFVPSLLFVKIVESKLSAPDMLRIIMHFAILLALMLVIGWQTAKLLGAGDRLRRAFTSTVLFYNSANYGVPVAQLAFGDLGVAVQAIVAMLQNITNFTVGLALFASGRGEGRWHTLKAIFKLPMIYVLIVAWAWRATQWPLPVPLNTALHTLSNGLVPVALVTLGAQMATLRSHRFSRTMTGSLFLRLCIGPILGFLIVKALGIQGALAQSLIVSTSFPTAVNVALLSMEFDNEPDFAAAVVFYSTLVSGITVSLVIFLVKQMPL